MDQITEEMARKIIDTEPTKIKETGVFNDIKLTADKKIEHAKKIL